MHSPALIFNNIKDILADIENYFLAGLDKIKLVSNI